MIGNTHTQLQREHPHGHTLYLSAAQQLQHWPVLGCTLQRASTERLGTQQPQAQRTIQHHIAAAHLVRAQQVKAAHVLLERHDHLRKRCGSVRVALRRKVSFLNAP